MLQFTCPQSPGFRVGCLGLADSVSQIYKQPAAINEVFYFGYTCQVGHFTMATGTM